MKQTQKGRISVLMITGILFLAVVGVTIAAYISAKTFHNQFTVGEPGIAIQERFNPTDKWLPGEQKEKKVWFANTGQQNMLLRFSIEVKDSTKGQESLTEAQIAEILKLCWADAETGEDSSSLTPVNFTRKEQDGRVYYYYDGVLDEGKRVYVFNSVIMDPGLTNDSHGVSYSGSRIDLIVTGEMVLADERAAEEQWSLRPVIAEAADPVTGVRKVSWN